MSPTAAAFAAGFLGLLAALEATAAASIAAQERGPRALRGLAAVADSLARAGSEGREPGALERRRLLAAAAAAALCAGTLLAGPRVGALLALTAPIAASRILRARRARYRGAVEAGAPAMATALSDALAAGHSLRGALLHAATGVPGAAGHELRRVGAELALGAPTQQALENMRTRCRSHPVDTIVAAALVQQRAGGKLAQLLRESARAFEDHANLVGEVKTATAQARFTGVVVVLLPLAGALLAELASPGYLAGLAGSFLTAWLVGIALVLQVVAAVAIRRLGRART